MTARRILIGLGVVLVIATALGVVLVMNVARWVDSIDTSGCSHTGEEGRVGVSFPNTPTDSLTDMSQLPHAQRYVVGSQFFPTDVTSLSPFDDGKVGPPVPFINKRAVGLSPDGRYLLTTEPSTADASKLAHQIRDVIRLRDRVVVARIQSGRLAFVEPESIIAFGARPGCVGGETVSVDLTASTSRPIAVRFSQSVYPEGVVGGQVLLCLEREVEAGSGPICEGTTMLDPTTGPTAPRSTTLALFEDRGEWTGTVNVQASQAVGGAVIYWWENPADQGAPLRRHPLRVGAVSGPQQGDPVGVTEFPKPDDIVPVGDNQSVLVEIRKEGIGRRWSHCVLPDLRCDEVTAMNNLPPDWHLVGVVDAPTIRGS